MVTMGATPTPRHLPAGATLQSGKYRIVKVLGQGGFGITYLAEHKNFGEVALKELFLSSGTAHCSRENTTQRHVVAHFDNAQFEDFKKRFLEEARTLFKLRDVKGVVKVIDIFEENSTVYFSMEYLEGDKLEDYVKKRKRLPEYEGIKIINSIGKTLADIHKRNVLHRDIKPANIIVTPNGDTFLIDFGIARGYADDVAETHTTFHSPRFSPPEQKIAKSRMGAFSDVYSLGATAYFVFTGELPQSLEERITENYLEPQYFVKNLSDSVNEAVNRSLTIREKDRIQTVDDFLVALGKPSFPKEGVQDVAPPPQYSPSSHEMTRLFTPKKTPPKIVSDDATQIEPPKTQSPPKIVSDDATQIEPQKTQPQPKNNLEDDKTMLFTPEQPVTPPPKAIIEDDKTMLDVSPLFVKDEPEIDQEKTLIFGQEKSVKEPDKPKLPFNFKDWIKTRDGRIIGVAGIFSVLAIVAALLSPLVCKPERKQLYVPPPRDTTTAQIVAPIIDTTQQTVPTAPVLPPTDTVKTVTKSNVPTKVTKPAPTKKGAKTTSTSSYPSNPSSAPINEVPVQAPTRVESTTPNSSQILYQGNGIILNRDMTCIINGSGGTYRRIRNANDWIEFDCILNNNHREVTVYYYKSSSALKIETKKN